MRFPHRIILAAMALLTAICLSNVSSTAHAQGVLIGHTIIPQSSIERPADIGRRAHTHLQLLAGPDGRPQFEGGIWPGPDGGLGPAGGISPAQLRQAYNLPTTGGSQIIAIIDAYDDPNALADFNTFAAKFGLPKETSANATASTNKVFQVLYGGGSKPGVDNTGGWEMEESLDIEWAHAMAPNAKIVLVEALSNNDTDLFTAEDTATAYTDGNGLKVKEISNSWGGGEFGGENTYDGHFASANVAYFASAGDNGAPAQYPSASPYVISAGGTTLNTNGSGNFTSETGWNGSGGGPSADESRPTFQNGISGIVGAWRGTPDLASAADPNTGASVYDSYPYYGASYGWVVVGGTSWSSPSLAGIANLAATAAGSFPAGSQALLSTIYSNLGTANFRDITVGNNGYAAKVGWDFVTGVGSCVGMAGLQGAAAPPPPAISSLSPSSANAGGASFMLTVNGTGYVNGSTIDWNGTALTTTVVSATQVTATVPASGIAAAGAANVTVVNPGPMTSSSATFTINAVANPTISSLNPSSATAGGASFTLTVNGTGYVNGSTIDWNGTALATTFVSATQVTATVPASDIASAGTASVTVVNPGPVKSNAATFTINSGNNNPAPTLTSISPNSANHNSGPVTITCTGTGFVVSSTAEWYFNGKMTVLTTTYVSPTQLTAVIPSSLLMTAGSAFVGIANPAPGGGMSGGVTFKVK